MKFTCNRCKQETDFTDEEIVKISLGILKEDEMLESLVEELETDKEIMLQLQEIDRIKRELGL